MPRFRQDRRNLTRVAHAAPFDAKRFDLIAIPKHLAAQFVALGMMVAEDDIEQAPRAEAVDDIDRCALHLIRLR